MAVLALVALGLSLTFILRSPEPSYVDRLEPLHRSVGYTLGHAVRAHSPEVSTVLVLQDRRPDPTRVRLSTQQRKGCGRGWANAACELVELDLRMISRGKKHPPGRRSRSRGASVFLRPVQGRGRGQPPGRDHRVLRGLPILCAPPPSSRPPSTTRLSGTWETKKMWTGMRNWRAGRVAARVGNKRNPDMQADLPRPCPWKRSSPRATNSSPRRKLVGSKTRLTSDIKTPRIRRAGGTHEYRPFRTHTQPKHESDDPNEAGPSSSLRDGSCFLPASALSDRNLPGRLDRPEQERPHGSVRRSGAERSTNGLRIFWRA